MVTPFPPSRPHPHDPLDAELEAAAASWRERGWPTPDVLVVAGSGLSTDLGQRLEGPHPWADVLPFPIVGIEGHPLAFELLEPVPGRVVLSSRGRLHYYQGYTLPQVVFMARLCALLGAKALVMTNSAGGLLAEQTPGDLVLLRDHLNLTGDNPLWGRFPESWGPQFPDMTHAYDPELRERIRESADELGIEISEGIYAGLGGPSYETPAEVRMLRGLGADVVGMSTVNEVIAAHHMGLRCACISVVSNPAAGVTDEILVHSDVLERGQVAARKVARILEHLLSLPDLL
jgi:purine-nucleoside phosphorylase